LTYTPVLHLCREELTSSGIVATVCGPLSPADLPLLGLILLVALAFLWPDLSEAGVPGLLTLKRRLEDVEKKTDDLTEDVRHVEVRQLAPRDLAELPAAVESKEQAVQSFTADAVIAGTTGAKPQAYEEFLAAWERIRPYAELRISATPSSADPAADVLRTLESREVVSPLDLAAIRIWQETFKGEIADLRAARNALMHGPGTLGDAQVSAAAEAAERLWRSLEALRQRVARA
jgi:hypothetical protein